MKARLNNNRGISLLIVLMVMAILLTVIGAGMIFSGINTKVAMNYRSGTRAFNAADTGLLAIALTITPGTMPSSTPVSLGNNLCYRFGTRDGVLPTMTPTVKQQPQYSLANGEAIGGTGYNFYQYTVNVTGMVGTGSPTTCPAINAETAAREVEALALYGPTQQ